MMRNLTLAIAVAALALVSVGALAYATASHSTDGRFAASRLIKVGAKPISARLTCSCTRAAFAQPI